MAVPYAILYFPVAIVSRKPMHIKGLSPLADSCSIIGKQHLFLPDIFQNFMQYLLDGKVLRLYFIIR